MKYIFILIHFYIIPTFSENVKPKLCVNCKFFRNDFLSSNKFGKCSLLSKVTYKSDDEIDYYLVNGIEPVKNIEYTYCSIARKYDSMCGKEGKFYEEKDNMFKLIKNFIKKD
jgi:hypothetical protein